MLITRIKTISFRNELIQIDILLKCSIKLTNDSKYLSYMHYFINDAELLNVL